MVSGRTDIAAPDVVLLGDEEEAHWVGLPRSFSLRVKTADPLEVVFRSRFEGDETPPATVLHVRALRSAAVYLDGQLVLARRKELDKWKEEQRVDLRPWLAPGPHVLEVSVFNRAGPAFSLPIARRSAWQRTMPGAGRRARTEGGGQR